jgi:hypothetical protein
MPRITSTEPEMNFMSKLSILYNAFSEFNVLFISSAIYYVPILLHVPRMYYLVMVLYSTGLN